MSGRSYIPSNDTVFCDFGKKVYDYAVKHHERWRVGAPTDEMIARMDDLCIKVEICSKPTRSKVDTAAKTEARRKVEKELRNYLQGFVMHNTNVTDIDRISMGLPIYDVVQTQVSNPEGQARAFITYPGQTQLKLAVRHIDGTPMDERANYGYRIYYGLYQHGDTPPSSGVDLRESLFSRRKNVLFSFLPSDSGKTAYFCIRYENSRGISGPWGPMFSSIIP